MSSLLVRSIAIAAVLAAAVLVYSFSRALGTDGEVAPSRSTARTEPAASVDASPDGTANFATAAGVRRDPEEAAGTGGSLAEDDSSEEARIAEILARNPALIDAIEDAENSSDPNVRAEANRLVDEIVRLESTEALAVR